MNLNLTNYVLCFKWKESIQIIVLNGKNPSKLVLMNDAKE
jgi:hypothetical protein